MPTTTTKRPQRDGIGAQVSSRPAIDPTHNVLLLVNAAVTRLNDVADSESRRLEQLLDMGFRRVDDAATLRSHYESLLSIAEAKRIDAIRAVDVNAVAVAAERQAASAAVLANQVVASADALRALVATTASTNLQAQEQSTKIFNERIASLEKASYEGKGRSAFTDPAMDALMAEVRKLAATQQQTGGKSEGRLSAWQLTIGAIALVASVLSVTAFLTKPTAPAVVYPFPAPVPTKP